MTTIYEQVDIVSTLTNILTSRVCSTRCTVSVEKYNVPDGTQTIPWTDSKLNHLFDSQSNAFERNALRCGIVYGYAIGRYTYSSGTPAKDRGPKDVIINALEPAEYTVRWGYDENDNVVYAVYPLMKTAPNYVDATVSVTETTEQDKEIENTFVIPFARLNPKLSIFNSVLYSKRERCGSLRLMDILSDLGVLRQVFPLVVKKINDTKYDLPMDSVTPEILATVNSGITEAGNTKFSFVEASHAVENAQRNGMAEIIRTMEEDPRNISARINEFFAKMNLFSPTLKSDLFKIIAEDPLKPAYTMVPGMTIEKDAPRSQLPANMMEYVEHLEDSVRQGFGIPKQAGRGDLTASIISNEELWLNTVQSYRITMEGVIRGLFWDIYGICFSDYKSSFPALLKDVSLSSIPVFVNLLATKPNAKKAVKVKTERIYKVAAMRKYDNMLGREVLLTVTYSPTTTSNLNDVLTLQERGVIGFEAFQRLASSAVRIPPNSHLNLSVEEYRKLDKRKVKELMTQPIEPVQQSGRSDSSAKPVKSSEPKAKRQTLESMDTLKEKQKNSELRDKD